MAAFAFRSSEFGNSAFPGFPSQGETPTRYFVRLDSEVAGAETDQTLLLEAVRGLTGSETAVFYSLKEYGRDVVAIAAVTSLAPRVKDVGVTLSQAASRWIDSLVETVQGSPQTEPNLEKFPEVLQYRLKRLALVPLRTSDRLIGLLALGRTTDTAFERREIDAAQRAGRLATAVFERDALRQNLIERKLMERAKGILQQRKRLSEEQAYLLLRNNSRRRRLPMAEVAREIIGLHVRPGVHQGVDPGLHPGLHPNVARQFQTA